MNRKLAALAAFLLYRRATRAERKRRQRHDENQYTQPADNLTARCATDLNEPENNQ